MNKEKNFTGGPILGPLLQFMIPILFALFLQSMYGAVDLLVVGQFAESTDVSAVSTGAQIMHTITNVVAAFSLGITVLVGQKIGERNPQMAGRIIGAGIFLFAVIGIVLTLLVPLGAGALATLMNAPEEAFELTKVYIRTCGAGLIIIIAYNLIGSIFRGLGDSVTPLVTVGIACVFNIAGDLLLVAVFHMGTFGAALATVGAQLVSVILSLLIIRRKKLPFTFGIRLIVPDGALMGNITRIGLPVALQDLLVGISFCVLLSIVNNISLTASAGVGVSSKVTAFIMLIPSAFSQAVSTFVAQNEGAGRFDRSRKVLLYAILCSIVSGVIMFYLAYFHGTMLCGIFSSKEDVRAAGAEYLRAYGVDCLLTCFLFCFLGFFNGLGETGFVMIQGIAGAFLVRIPFAYLMSRQEPVHLFRIGLATPLSTIFQITLCLLWLTVISRRRRRLRNNMSESIREKEE